MTDREIRFAEIQAEFLPDDLLERIRGRAAAYDRENRFFQEDFDELVEHGYLKLFVPKDMGGPGLGMNEVSRLQQVLAKAAPATALGINMHLVWTGVARALLERGDDSHRFVLEETAAGEVFAFGVSEPGNDLVLYGSTTAAVPTGDGGYRFTGKKIFTSLSPVWTRLGAHGLDEIDPEDKRIVYGFIERGEDGIAVSEHWDPMGMRATQSRSTTLTDVPMRADRVTRRIPDGMTPDSLTFAINAHFQLLIASVYTGLAARALELAGEALHKRASRKNEVTYAELPEFRDRVADAAILYESVPPQLDSYTRDFDDLVDHGAGWPRRFVGAKLRATEMARRVVEDAFRCAGGAAFDNSSELNRLYRDALAGMFHPSGWDGARPLFAGAYLDQ
ncbi:acyl-CoA dehydrogenase family protein [Gulosibacter molinativorax]|uniref:Acyl-CoA dehydrogenase n=1 Tax=Gulosibacter molinativorax TaxID=256821 RepID=A0ABT7CAI8_9MICO|nr:acyl-CoA dehydrogenase family protein [Gulosibacter molinativorax]MDJ1372206.1 acyl-CoA dehydrogenase [Gulosibacter molinativorax]QUY60921.1 Putative acyl-CoA dehydrogenase YdbM [Gulosibacter molinativorax]